MTVRITVGIPCWDNPRQAISVAHQIAKVEDSRLYNVIIYQTRDSLPRASNRLLELCQTDYFIRVDDDIRYFRWPVFPFIINVMDANPDVGLFLASEYDLDDYGIIDETRNTPYASFCFAVIRKSCGVRFEELYIRNQYEDVDYMREMRYAGYEILGSKKIFPTHLPHTTGKISRLAFYRFILTRSFEKWECSRQILRTLRKVLPKHLSKHEKPNTEGFLHFNRRIFLEKWGCPPQISPEHHDGWKTRRMWVRDEAQYAQ